MDVIEQWPIAPIAAGACEIKVKPQMAQPGGSKLREPNPAHMLQIGDLRGCVTRCLAPGDNVAHCPAGAGITRKKNCLWLAQSSAATFARLGLLYGPGRGDRAILAVLFFWSHWSFSGSFFGMAGKDYPRLSIGLRRRQG